MKLPPSRLPPVATLRAGRAARRWRASRRGFTLLEFIVALLMFGIAMSALFPLVVMYSRVLESLEQRPNQLSFHRSAGVDGRDYRVAHPLEWYQVPTGPGAPNAGEWVHRWYLVPSSDSAARTADAWARKLGASASIKYFSPTGTLEEPLAEPTQANIIAWDAVGGTTAYYVETPQDGWSDEAPAAAWNGNQRRQPPGLAATAAWLFTVPDDGWYRIEATGLVAGSPPAGCNYTISSGAPATEVTVPMPAGQTFGASAIWSPLAIKHFSSGPVTVRLNAAATESALADGMRLVRCSVQITSWTPPLAAGTATVSVEIKPAIRQAP
jgi:prepilin-type N-terminal cleavage/methylation domain-containing protein